MAAVAAGSETAMSAVLSAAGSSPICSERTLTGQAPAFLAFAPVNCGLKTGGCPLIPLSSWAPCTQRAGCESCLIRLGSRPAQTESSVSASMASQPSVTACRLVPAQRGRVDRPSGLVRALSFWTFCAASF